VGITTQVGLFGKTPHVGDFVERRIHPAFRTLWDEWLQEGMAASQQALGEAWLDVYLTSPVWRFAFSAHICGEAVYAGVLVPSVDRVGRYFPLSIVASLPADISSVGLLAAGQQWFVAAEAVLLRVLEGQIADVDEFDREVNDLAVPLATVLDGIGNLLPGRGDSDLFVPLRHARELAPRLAELCETLLVRARGGPSSYWLTQGSARVSPRFLAVAGLPGAQQFAAILNGELNPAEWQELPTRAVVPFVRPSPVMSRIVSSIRTDRGHVRTANEDSAAARADFGMWVVADGMGGYRDGALASSAVCAALESVAWEGDLAARVAIATATLRGVNEDLRNSSKARDQQISSASTALVLLIHDDECACVWSGDSRLYRLRDGALQQISEDHAVGERPSAESPGGSHRLTAGIGVDDELRVDVAYSKVNAGDRFLLCSDGVHEALDASQLADGLLQPDAGTAAHALISSVLLGSATDNATVVAVFVP
jgi:type VI secretion system protein ImpM